MEKEKEKKIRKGKYFFYRGEEKQRKRNQNKILGEVKYFFFAEEKKK